MKANPMQAVKALAACPSVRVLLILARGRHFCGGIDTGYLQVRKQIMTVHKQVIKWKEKVRKQPAPALHGNDSSALWQDPSVHADPGPD